jgi:hypothetical protein
MIVSFHHQNHENTKRVMQYLSYRCGQLQNAGAPRLTLREPSIKAIELWCSEKMQMANIPSVSKRKIDLISDPTLYSFKKPHSKPTFTYKGRVSATRGSSDKVAAAERIAPAIAKETKTAELTQAKVALINQIEEKNDPNSTSSDEENFQDLDLNKNKRIRYEFEKLEKNLITKHRQESPKCKKFVKQLKHEKKVELQKNRIRRDCERRRERLDKIIFNHFY